MTGQKATHLDAWARARGQAYLRFDYSGHGSSDGRFEDGSIGRWTEDALAMIDACGDEPLVLVGSSMGGWIMLLAALALQARPGQLARPARVRGLVGIAAAPDFTEDLVWDQLSADGQAAMIANGGHRQPSAYDVEARFIPTFWSKKGATICCCEHRSNWICRCGCCMARKTKTCRGGYRKDCWSG